MYIRQSPRVMSWTLPRERQPLVVIQGERFSVRNISEGGLCIWLVNPTYENLLSGKKILEASFSLGEETFPVTLELVHHSPSYVGVKMISQPEALQNTLQEITFPARCGVSLVRHEKSEMLDPETGYTKLWYTGKDNTELLVWYNGLHRVIVGIQCIFGRSWVRRDHAQQVVCGTLKADVHPSGIALDSMSCEETSLKVQMNILREASQFLMAATESLPGTAFWQFLELGEMVLLPPTEDAPSRAG